MLNKAGGTTCPMRTLISKSLFLLAMVGLSSCASLADQAQLRINQLQFVGSHNSYKKAMLAEDMAALQTRNPTAAASLDYEHVPLTQQLDMGLRKLELDVFYTPPTFTVGHVQQIDMQTHCTPLEVCLQQVLVWSQTNPQHIPLWISFNLKDQQIEGLPDPQPFTAAAFRELDQLLSTELGAKLLWPREVIGSNGPQWPLLAEARGKLLLILDEGGSKRSEYAANWAQRPMFVTVGPEHPAAAIMVLNNPLTQADEIRQMVQAGYMVRTRADADTREARTGDTRKREAAFASGAQAISTDYYLPASRFARPGQDPYAVNPELLCNPVLTDADCLVSE